MAEEQTPQSCDTTTETVVENRGMFDFLKKKKEEEKPEEVAIATEMEKVQICEPEEKKEEVVHEEEEEKKPSLLEKLHRSDSSSSSSSSEEEVEEGGEKIKRKKKKGLKEKIKEKIAPCEKKEEKKVEDTSIPIEKFEDPDVSVVTHDGVVKHPEEKKTFMEKIKEKLPGGKKPEEAAVVECAPSEVPVHEAEASPKEKKGILEKIKEKLPGYHKTEEEKKETTTDH